MAALPEQTIQPERRRALKEWIFANVVRGPIMGDVYTLWNDSHIDAWIVHGLVREGAKMKVLMLTDGHNCHICHIWAHEWEDMARKGLIRFTGENYLWK